MRSGACPAGRRPVPYCDDVCAVGGRVEQRLELTRASGSGRVGAQRDRGTRPPPFWWSIASLSDSELGPADCAEHLLLVEDRAAFVGSHFGRVVRRDEKAVDVRRRDGQPEVVADEAPPART